MRNIVFAALCAATLFVFPGASRAVEVEVTPPGPAIVVPEGRSLSAGECERLREACLKKEELGEEGEGNCARYRAHCR